MPHFDKASSPLKDDLTARSLRSSSPAVKRPASDMGAQDREDHTRDVEMPDADAASSPLAQPASNNGKRHKNDSHMSDPHPVSQLAPSKASSGSESTVPSSTASASTTATSLTDTTDALARPTIDEQVAKVLTLARETAKDGEKGYVVSCKWLSRVVARCSDPPPGLPYDKAAMDEEIGPVNNADIAMVTEDTGKMKDEAGEPFTPLRPGLQLNEDMQVLPQAAWDLILQWYGLAPDSPIITRYAHALSEDNPQEVQYELNPPIFSFLKVVGTHTLQAQRDADLPPPRMVASVHRPFMSWLREAKELVHTDMNTKVRVWRVLGGLKSTSASGILTPAASRSASPAPGAEIIASAGSKMIVDVNTFSLLSLGDQRELIDQKDQTMNPNYNGKVDLRTIGLGRSDVIVLEEQTAKPDEYPSDHQRFSLKGAAKAKSQNLTVSGRSSPTPSIMTRGRAQREGRPKGIVGLQNLGNTCYMNSALQCIRSVDELTEYFRCNYWNKDVNYDNPLGHHGEIAKAYAGFINGVYSSGGAYSPAPFKRVVGKYGPNFAGYGQQDSQEFLAFLLDGLSEDLNRIHKKPYIEKPDSTDEMVGNDQLLKEFADRNWNIFKARNDSVVIDLFAGMYKSTLTCPVCDKVSIVFDPFTNLTLQLPLENNWAKEVIYFPLYRKPYRVDVDIDKNSSILDLKKFVAQRTKSDPDKIMCAESYKNKFFRFFDNTEIIAETNFASNDVICLYELPEQPTNYDPNKKKRFSHFSYNKDADPKVEPDSPAADRLMTTVFHRVSRPNGNNRMIPTFFAHPSFVVLSRADRRSYDALYKKMIAHVVGMSTLDFLGDDVVFEDTDETPEDSDAVVVSNESNGSESPSASATSVQDEDGIVDVSMRDGSQEPDERYAGNLGLQKLMRSRTVPNKLKQLFDIRVAHTDDGIPLGWNNILENQPYVSVHEKAAELARSLPHRPRPSTDEEHDESSASDQAETEHVEQAPSPDSPSEAGDSPKPPSDDEGSLPDASDLISGKDTRGASKHARKKQYARKGKKLMNKAPRKSPPPPPQPEPSSTDSTDLVVPGDAIILDWDLGCYEALFEGALADDDNMRGTLTHRDLELLEDEELAVKRASRLDRKKHGVSLSDCLNEFGKTETLSEQNAWYCPRCKEHRRADKQFELWKVPDVLVMHLKRFSSSRNFRDKLELKVEYPIEGLDMTDMVRDQSDGKSLTYDLIAVDNHFGGLGGGHYTALAKNSVTGNWYDYNDSHVSQVKDESSVVQKSAYLLFYRRRSEHPLGGERLEHILSEADSEEQTQSRDPSPSGKVGVSAAPPTLGRRALAVDLTWWERARRQTIHQRRKVWLRVKNPRVKVT